MQITVFDVLSDMDVFIRNTKDFICYNCVGRQESSKVEDKTTVDTEIVVYSNVGILFHTSKNKFKTETTLTPIARKETVLMDDKATLFAKMAEELHLIKNSVRLGPKNIIEIGYLNKKQTKDIIRTTA